MLRGVPCTEQHRARISGANKGRTQSLEQRAVTGAAIRTGKGNTVRCIGHPYATKTGYVMRSHIVWEFAHGYFLHPWFIIHHINGIHTDDHPENLAPMFRSQHIWWHYQDSV